MAKARVERSASLIRKLKALQKETSAKVMPAMEDVSDIITDTMRSFAPVDSGDLKEAIGWTWGNAPRGSVSMSHSRGGSTITIYAGNEKAFYARWVEFGTAPHATGKGSDISVGKGKKQFGTMHPGTAPQPFFYPAYRLHKKTVKRKINAAVKKAVIEAVK